MILHQKLNFFYQVIDQLAPVADQLFFQCKKEKYINVHNTTTNTHYILVHQNFKKHLINQK